MVLKTQSELRPLEALEQLPWLYVGSSKKIIFFWYWVIFLPGATLSLYLIQYLALLCYGVY